MDQASFDFWQKHSLQFLEMALRADKRERFAPADGYGQAQGACGDIVHIFLQVRDGHICSASFETNGCLYTVACANTVVHLAEGKTLLEAQSIDPESVFRWLETLPEEEFHCAELAVGALQMALAGVEPAAANQTGACVNRHEPGTSDITGPSLPPVEERQNP